MGRDGTGWYGAVRSPGPARLAHNPKVAGSNPAPATICAGQRPFPCQERASHASRLKPDDQGLSADRRVRECAGHSVAMAPFGVVALESGSSCHPFVTAGRRLLLRRAEFLSAWRMTIHDQYRGSRAAFMRGRVDTDPPPSRRRRGVWIRERESGRRQGSPKPRPARRVRARGDALLDCLGTRRRRASWRRWRFERSASTRAFSRGLR